MLRAVREQCEHRKPTNKEKMKTKTNQSRLFHRKLYVSLVLILTVLWVPLTVRADYRRWSPPAKKGYVYVVIKYKSLAGQPTNVKITWGNWSNSGQFTAARALLPGRGVPSGFVIRLEHKKADSVPIEVETDGRIFGISQPDSPPSEWNDTSNYKTVKW